MKKDTEQLGLIGVQFPTRHVTCHMSMLVAPWSPQSSRGTDVLVSALAFNVCILIIIPVAMLIVSG